MAFAGLVQMKGFADLCAPCAAGDLGLEVGDGLECGRRILRWVMVAKKPVEDAEQSAEWRAGIIHAPEPSARDRKRKSVSHSAKRSMVIVGTKQTTKCNCEPQPAGRERRSVS